MQIWAVENDKHSLFGEKFAKRIIIDLSGDWKYSPDKTNWRSVKVPSGQDEDGELWHRKTIKIDKKLVKNKSWHLFFGGLSENIEIYINGQYLGKWLGGMAPFWVSIPRKFLEGDNVELEFKITGKSGLAMRSDEFSLGASKINSGLLRSLFFIGTANTWVSKININSDYDVLKKQALVNFEIDVANQVNKQITNQGKLSLELSVYDGENRIFTKIKKIGKISANHKIIKYSLNMSKPRLWSASAPNEYKLSLRILDGSDTLSALIDSYDKSFGIKKLAETGSGYELNGKNIFIKAVDYIEGFGDQNKSLTRKQIEKDVRMIKSLGANAVRFKFTPPHPLMARLCSEYGLLMFIDLPTASMPKSIYSRDEVSVRLENLSKMYFDYYGGESSFAAWGISWWPNLAKKSLAHGQNYYKILDIKGIQSGISDWDLNNGMTIVEINDKLMSIEDIKQSLEKINSNSPIALDFSSHGDSENNNGFSDNLSIDYRAHRFRNLYYLSKTQNFSGVFVNAFNDYKLQYPLLIGGAEDLFLSSSGLVSIDREINLAYKTVQSIFNSTKEPLLNSGNTIADINYIFTVIGIGIVLIMMFLFNRLRRFREYFIRSLLRPHNFYSDIRDQRLISLYQSLLLALFVSLTLGIYIAELFYYNRDNIETQRFMVFGIQNIEILVNLFSLIWQEVLFMILISATALILFFVMSAMLKVFSFWVRSRIFIQDTMTIIAWSSLPLIFLLPIALFMGKMIQNAPWVNMFFILILLFFLLWFFLRLLRATAVVFDVSAWKVKFLGLGVSLLIVLFPLSYLQIHYSVVDYFKYYVTYWL